MIRIERTVAPVISALSVQTARDWLRLDTIDAGAYDAALDSEIAALVAAAVDLVEAQTGRVLLPSTWRVSLDSWPVDGVILLPMSPVSAVVSVQYLDVYGVLQTLHPDNVQIVLDGDYPAIHRAPGVSWPGLCVSPVAVQIAVQAGYANAAAIPPAIVMALRLLLAHWFTNRAAVQVGPAASELPLGVPALLSSVARVRL